MGTYLHFETERLILRPTDLTDASFLVALYNTPKWLKYIGDRKIKTIAQAKQFIEARILPQLITLGYSNYTVIRKADQTKIGACGLYDREGLIGIDLGFAFLPEYEKQGYAFEASSVLMDAANKQFGLESLGAITTKDNNDSQSLLKKLGFEYTKMIKLTDDAEELMFFQFVFRTYNE
jgi:RimJ/RimL family protein N-acetyltransferase